jgi:hypothetical protein
MTARAGPWIAITGGGIAWAAHLFTGYFLVALGCPRSWPVDVMLAVVTVTTASVALGIGVAGVRGWRGAKRHDGPDARTLMFAAGALLAGLFALGIVLGGVAALILSPCRGAAIGA